jgi:glycosyltransferase involved in cell wall biosynthesis
LLISISTYLLLILMACDGFVNRPKFIKFLRCKLQLKILTLSHEFPPIGTGGGRVAEDIAAGLVERGCEVSVVTPNLNNGDLPVEEVRNGVWIIRIPTKRKELHQAAFSDMADYLFKGFLPAGRFIRDWQPDLIHVHFAVPAGVLAWALTRFKKVPYVITAHLGDVPGGAPAKTKGWFRWVFPFTPPIWKSAARVIAVSEFTRMLALQSYDVGVEVIPNGVEFNDVPRETQVSDPPRIVFAGRFVDQKNPIEIIRILARLRDLPWEFTMLGNGPLFAATEKAVRDSGLEDRVHLPGWVDTETVLAELEKSDILFMPSKSEGMPMIGLQALAAGLALIGGNLGGFVDLIEDGKNGFLCVPNDYVGIQENLRKLLVDRDALLAAKEHSRKLAPRFDIKTVVKMYLELFEEILGVEA